jgi:PIN domain nuclease of toxin-antitoxin system
MNLLLDTHTLIWFLNGDAPLSENAKAKIQQDGNSNFISIASIWEIAIKISLGKLEINRPFTELESQITDNGFHILPSSFSDTLLVSNLPFHNRDPFDRIIAAQGINNKLTIISRDVVFKEYTADVIW